MATHARQQYFADESSLSKEKREFSIAEEVQQKIDSIEEGAQVNTIETIKVNGSEVQPDENKAVDLTIPGVVDSLDSTSSTDALSAKQGKVLYDYIQDVSHIGHFLALWDASTGLPVTDPETSPYIYNTGDFYTVSVVASGGGTNYKPDGTQYVIGQASTAVDTDGVEVNDFYFYDGQVWRHMKNSGAGSIAVDGSLSTTSTNPVENRVITNALNGKADATDINTKTFYLSSDSDLTTAQAAYDWYSAGKNPIIDYQNDEYFFHGTMSGGIFFLGSTITTGGQYTGTSSLFEKTLLFNVSNGAVTSIVDTIRNNSISYIDTITPTTAFTPTHDWQPATKKYVDDHAGTTYTAGANIQISNENVISATDTTYTAGTNVQISNENVISATDTTYTAGKGISIGDINDYSAMRGPCPEGFHIPSNEERDALKTIMRDSLGTRDGTNWIRHLHMPLSGFRTQSGSVSSQGTSGIFWSSTSGRIFSLSAQDGYPGYGQGNMRGQSVRGFKDSYVEPDSTWTVALGTLGSAGIFWNQSEGLISITNGSTGYTIMDKNLGATTVYNDGDALTEANMGYMYQWGNNYGFPSTGTISGTSSTKVDASGYGPGNYYESNTFITGNYGENRDTSNNANLRGGVTGVVTFDNAITNIGVTSINGQTGDVVLNSAEWGNITGTLSDQTDLQDALDEKQDKLTAGEGIEIRNGTDYSAMRGPCPSGYHIPSANEWDAVCSTLTTTFGFASSATTIGTYLKMPMAGDRDESTSNIEYAGERGFYRTSTPYSISHAYNLGATSSALSSGGKSYRAHGYPLRGFKDEPVAPDNTWTTLYDGSSVAAGAGVFRNSSLGLISLSGDGTTWTTIMDKNIGATDTDITSTDSYGYYYQWGNNYGFATTGSVTTSSTQVDTTGYGPGNYYNNSTFIQVAIDGDWSSVQNDNLWGGVTGAVILNNAITNTGVLSVNGEVGNVSIAKIITGTTYAQLGERLAAYLNEKGATPATYTDMGLVGIWDANLYYFQGFSTVTAGSQYRFTFQSLVTDTTTVSGSYNRTSHKLRRFVLNRDSTQSVWSYDSHDTNYIMIASNNYLQTNVDYTTPYTPQYDGSPATKKYVDDSVNLKSFGAFPGSGLSDLQDLYDWLVSGNYAQVTYQNQVYIFGPTNVTTGDVESYVMRETNISSNESGVLDMKDTMLTFAVSDGTVTGNYGADSTTTGQGRIIYVNSAAGQPSNPQASSFWYDTTNNKLKVYDGSNWNVVGDESADINTKTFTISSTSDLTNAQAAYDWYLAGKNPIVKYGDNFLTCAGVWQDAIPATKYYLAFTSTWVGQLKDTDSPARWAQAPNINNREILLEFANDVVSAIIEDYTAPAFLPTNSGVEILYTPYYDWDPATKGYVDDTIATAYEGGPGIAVGMIHSDRQGPCPDGWHVPSQAEWSAIITAGDTMSAWSTGTDVSTKLKLPFAGYRSYSDGNVSNSGSTGYYWSSDCTTATDTAYQLQISSSVKNASAASIRSYGASIRAIKDKPIIPDAGWVTIYDGSATATGAGVFREDTEGLISISADGTTWYTIMDKNLGASSVWESGVTLSSYNCGYYYQRGNNYGFAGIGGTVTTTSNRQSASGYGPQNPYSYSSFITYLGNWDTSNNKNLWGGVTNGTRFGEEGTMIVNTGVTSVNGQTGDVTVTGGDMNYADFNWQAKTGATVTLDLASTITPTANFTVNAPSTIRDGQTYILRVNNGATAYTMTLGTNITNPYQESTLLTADGIDQFIFLAVGGNLELQPSTGASVGDYVESVNGNSGAVTLKTINNTAIVGSGNIAVQATLSNISASIIKAGTSTTKYAVTAAALAGGLVRISSAANNILANGGKLWAGTQEDYEALTSYDEDTVYLTI